MSLAIGTSVQKKMNTALPEFGISEGQLWRHSMASALAAEEAAAGGGHAGVRGERDLVHEAERVDVVPDSETSWRRSTS